MCPGCGRDAEIVRLAPFRRYPGSADQGTGANSIADAVVLLEDHLGNAVAASETATVTCLTGGTSPNPLVAQPGTDFVSTSTAVTFDPGDTQATFPIEIIGDSYVGVRRPLRSQPIGVWRTNSRYETSSRTVATMHRPKTFTSSPR